eukprot:TRINITY_DN15103_c0_g1_i1.p1 TRINITY_DN15103_c0_g1~~TRINITY_DN15103_c0_g1_i1.p1  ORF type:complete len:230 (+),score=33.81 TRINITY_DN15103_c0_g1_i1:55-690(+)
MFDATDSSTVTSVQALGETVVVNVDGSLASSLDQPIKLTTVSVAPLAHVCIEDHAPHDLHVADDCPAPSPGETAVVNIDGSLALSTDQPIKLTTVSGAPLADACIEDHAPHDLHAADDCSAPLPLDTTEFLSAGSFLNEGSAFHGVGTCIPCKFLLTTLGCNIGLRCSFCHHPHEGITRNTLRKRLKSAKKEFGRARNAKNAEADGEAVDH